MEIITIRRGTPEVAYMAMLNRSIVSSSGVVMENGELAFHEFGAGYDGLGMVSGDDDDTAQTLDEGLMGVVAGNQGDVGYLEYGNVQVWGVNTAVNKRTSTPGSDWSSATQAWVAYAIGDAQVAIAASIAEDSDDVSPTQTTSNVLGTVMATAAEATTTGSIFIRKLGV